MSIVPALRAVGIELPAPPKRPLISPIEMRDG